MEVTDSSVGSVLSGWLATDGQLVVLILNKNIPEIYRRETVILLDIVLTSLKSSCCVNN